MPTDMSTAQCRNWLRENVGHVETASQSERQRVQAIVDGLLAKKRVFSFDELGSENIITGSADIELDIEDDISTKGLADVVADEKAENIELQRPAIQQLGRHKLRNMIRLIFEAVASGNYQAKVIAGEYGLSLATFSRFAGNCWLGTGGSSNLPVPDLWLNTTEVLAGDSDFAGVIESSGVLGHIEQILEQNALESRA